MPVGGREPGLKNTTGGGPPSRPDGVRRLAVHAAGGKAPSDACMPLSPHPPSPPPCCGAVRTSVLRSSWKDSRA
eukprot:scaffold7213_cov118-Isochrysis_galbana.AAC.6